MTSPRPPERFHPQPFDTDVLILGAGPVGLTLANLLGGYGIRTVVADAGEKLIDYPRGRPGRRVAPVVPDRRRRRAGLPTPRRSTSCGWSTARARCWPTSHPAPRTSAGRGATASSSRWWTPSSSPGSRGSTTSTSVLAHPARLRRRRRRGHRDRRTRRRHHEDHPRPVSRGLRRRPQHHPQVDGRHVRGPVVTHAVPGHRRPQRPAGHAERLPRSRPGPPVRPSGCRTASAASSS